MSFANEQHYMRMADAEVAEETPPVFLRQAEGVPVFYGKAALQVIELKYAGQTGRGEKTAGEDMIEVVMAAEPDGTGIASKIVPLDDLLGVVMSPSYPA